MARGGARPNSGRKDGAATEKTREVADKAASDGEITPLEVIIKSMRYAWESAEAEQNKAAKLLMLESASDLAVKAAPYIHAKLASVEIKNPEGESFRTQSEISPDDKTLIERHLALLQKAAK